MVQTHSDSWDDVLLSIPDPIPHGPIVQEDYQRAFCFDVRREPDDPGHVLRGKSEVKNNNIYPSQASYAVLVEESQAFFKLSHAAHQQYF